METLKVKPAQIKKVLIAEDDSSIRGVLEVLLDSLGYSYLSATNGEEATQILSSQSVDVLITDFQMPKMDGIELLKWCRGRGYHLPVIFISANAELVPQQEVALQDCCATLMKKPLNIDVLIDALGAATSLLHHPNCVHERNTPVD